MDDTIPGKFEITKEGIVHDLLRPNGPHELTVARLRRLLERVMPEDLAAPTGSADVEDELKSVMMRDYPLIGIPVYAIVDPRTGTGAVLTDIHPTPGGPRHATRKDFVHGEDVTIADWTIPTTGLPRYRDQDS